MESPHVLLRVAAFLVDALLIGLVLVLVATVASWGTIVVLDSTDHLDLVWMVSFVLLTLGVMTRDGWLGRSFGKMIFGLRVRSRSGDRCGWIRSTVRNLPLVIPGWNVIEIALLFFTKDGRRSGDRIAGTRVGEE